MSDVLQSNHEKHFAPEQVGDITERLQVLSVAERLVEIALGNEEGADGQLPQ